MTNDLSSPYITPVVPAQHDENRLGQPRRAWMDGPAAPLVTPFHKDYTVNHEALAAQVVRVARERCGVVLLGTTGEVASLSESERLECVKTARKALDDAGLSDAPLMVGTGYGSAYTTIKLTNACAQAGASHALLIFPGFFSFHMSTDRRAVMDFFNQVLDQSLIPVLIYSFPGPSGIDLSSEELLNLANHPMCFGVKAGLHLPSLTCAIVGKGQRLATLTTSQPYLKQHRDALSEWTESGRFQILQGRADSVLAVLFAGHTGCISGIVGFLPKTLRKLYDLSVLGLEGDAHALQEAKELQVKVAECEAILGRISFSGLKYALDRYVSPGLGHVVRSPLPPLSEVATKAVEGELAPFWKLETSI